MFRGFGLYGLFFCSLGGGGGVQGYHLGYGFTGWYSCQCEIRHDMLHHFPDATVVWTACFAYMILHSIAI